MSTWIVDGLEQLFIGACVVALGLAVLTRKVGRAVDDAKKRRTTTEDNRGL